MLILHVRRKYCKKGLGLFQVAISFDQKVMCSQFNMR
eukprot:UN16353